MTPLRITLKNTDLMELPQKRQSSDSPENDLILFPIVFSCGREKPEPLQYIMKLMIARNDYLIIR